MIIYKFAPRKFYVVGICSKTDAAYLTKLIPSIKITDSPTEIIAITRLTDALFVLSHQISSPLYETFY